MGCAGWLSDSVRLLLGGSSAKPKTLPLDLRSLVAAAVARGEPVRAVAACIQVSASSAVRLSTTVAIRLGL